MLKQMNFKGYLFNVCRPTHFLSSLKSLMASDSSSGFSHSFRNTQNTSERVEEKNERTNSDLGQIQEQEREFSVHL